MKENDSTQVHGILNTSENEICQQNRFFTRDSWILLSGFFLVILLIAYFWWPLATAVFRRMYFGKFWMGGIDWFLIGIFAFMSVAIIAKANLKTDALILFVGVCGGFIIEAWGTQTNLWVYYTAERPPLWIIPAWPIASLTIDRITRTLSYAIKKQKNTKIFQILYWVLFLSFLGIMIPFISPTFNKSYTIISFFLCIFLVFTPTNYKYATLTFIAGTGLGYFLELWGTTNKCWIYYTHETPPLFAVLAHGIAAVAFWRAGRIVTYCFSFIKKHFLRLQTQTT